MKLETDLSVQLKGSLKKVFGYDNFRGNQGEIIE
ncbi:MAG: superfamily II DNA helicase RecQ, partial [Gammaproteobacteria bacterium]